MSKCIKCGSYAFNLYKEEIDQGGLCDVHYWQGRAHRAEALAEQPAQQETSNESAYQRGYLDGMAKPCVECADCKLKGMAERPTQQEPVAWISKHGVVYPLDAKDEVHPINELQPLYTSPPAQRKPWVGLTDDESGEIYYRFDGMELMRAIEDKLKEKNT